MIGVPFFLLFGLNKETPLKEKGQQGTIQEPRKNRRPYTPARRHTHVLQAHMNMMKPCVTQIQMLEEPRDL